MPLYDYLCTKCNTPVERLVKYEERDKQTCDCGYMMLRLLSKPVLGGERYKPGVVLGNGQKVAGNFGLTKKRGRTE